MIGLEIGANLVGMYLFSNDAVVCLNLLYLSLYSDLLSLSMYSDHLLSNRIIFFADQNNICQWSNLLDSIIGKFCLSFYESLNGISFWFNLNLQS